MSTQAIPQAIQIQVERIVARFNQETFANPARGYQPVKNPLTPAQMHLPDR